MSAEMGWGSPALVQFHHLSFAESSYAVHLCLLVDALLADGSWPHAATNEAASAFVNSPHLKNTSLVAAGKLGTLLAQQRPT